MMKKVLLSACVAIITSVVAFAEQNIAVFDLEKVVRLHPNTESDKALLEQTANDYKAEKDRIEGELLKIRDEAEKIILDSQNQALSEAKRKAAVEAAKAKDKTFRESAMKAEERFREMQRSLNEQEARMIKRTIDAIGVVVKEYAKENNIDMVLNLPSPKLGLPVSILYFEPQYDITSAIMERMNIKDVASDKDSNVEEK